MFALNDKKGTFLSEFMGVSGNSGLSLISVHSILFIIEEFVKVNVAMIDGMVSF